MPGHHEWDCHFIKLDLVPYEDGPHTGLKCNICGARFEEWMSHQVHQILKTILEVRDANYRNRLR